MSLEQALSENTAALREHTAALREHTANMRETVVTAVAKQTPAETPEPAAKKTVAETPATTPPAPETAEPVAAAETVTESLSDDAVPTIGDLTYATTGAATRNREGLVALIKSYGVARAGSIPETLWAEYIEKAKAL